VLRVIVRDF